MLRAAAGGVSRRRVQTVVIFTVLLVSTAAATLGLGLLAAAAGPFQQAFAAQHGAHVTMAFDTGRATRAQLIATGRARGVIQSAGPFPMADAGLTGAATGSLGSLALVGRTSSGGPLDDLTLQSGRWVRRPGEVVLSSGVAWDALLGSTFTASTAPGAPKLTVVGIAASATDSADGWVVPAEVHALRAAGAPATAQMMYRFASAGSDAQIRADVAAITAALPAGAVAGSASWLAAQQLAQGTGAIIAPFVVAFGIMGLAVSVLVVINVVSGAVAASYRRIGVLKSIGFSPGQVIAAYVARVGVPAAAGCALGVGLGNGLAVPVLRRSAEAFSGASRSVPVWVDVVTPLAMLAMAGLAALLPALRAGRLPAVAAIATGQAPRPGRGQAAHRVLSGLRLPRPVTIGLAAPFARPARTTVTLTAVALGAAAVIFAAGLETSVARVTTDRSHVNPGEVSLWLANGGNLRPDGAQARKAVAAIRSQPGTLHYVAESTLSITASGLPGQVNAHLFGGDTGWVGMDMISGRWYRAADEVDVNSAFLSRAGLALGDHVTLVSGGRQFTARIAGEVFDPAGGQPVLFAGSQALGGSGLPIFQYDVGLRPGTDPGTYATALNQALGSQFSAGTNEAGGKFQQIITALIGLLTLMMAVAAGLGVLNTVLLGTRERVHDLGVFKALGMTPRQTITMVVNWVTGPAAAGALLAVPLGIVLHWAIIRAMGRAADTGVPADVAHVYTPAELALFALSALVIAAAGALGPANWAARSRSAAALRTE
ncbi:MAG: hypothetical protein JOY82_21265 [Streptosporangiaceae bacterium]|nr:hypothetical protein [Streptosporangiaceae bacterium]MBV9857014.1 hypothetical protein [Streptosporangiaceae bacterium]